METGQVVKINVKKNVVKRKIKLVVKPGDEKQVMDAELQRAIINSAERFTERTKYGFHHYSTEFNNSEVWIMMKGDDGIMRKMKKQVKVYEKKYKRRMNDTYYNRYFDVKDIKKAGIYREGYDSEHTTLGGLKMQKDMRCYPGATLEDLRAHMVDNGCTSTDARAMNYKQRVKWIMTADYDKEDGDVWKAVLARGDKKETQQKATKKKREEEEEKKRRALEEKENKNKKVEEVEGDIKQLEEKIQKKHLYKKTKGCIE